MAAIVHKSAAWTLFKWMTKMTLGDSVAVMTSPLLGTGSPQFQGHFTETMDYFPSSSCRSAAELVQCAGQGNMLWSPRARLVGEPWPSRLMGTLSHWFL